MPGGTPDGQKGFRRQVKPHDGPISVMLVYGWWRTEGGAGQPLGQGPGAARVERSQVNAESYRGEGGAGWAPPGLAGDRGQPFWERCGIAVLPGATSVAVARQRRAMLGLARRTGGGAALGGGRGRRRAGGGRAPPLTTGASGWGVRLWVQVGQWWPNRRCGASAGLRLGCRARGRVSEGVACCRCSVHGLLTLFVSVVPGAGRAGVHEL